MYLGTLEREVMTLMWRQGESSVNEIHRLLGDYKAYTTVMTTLDRLHKKGLLTRRKKGRAFLYSPLMSREELDRGLTEDVIEGLLNRAAGEANPMLACIVEAVSERDRELLDELERLVRLKRHELARKESK